MSRQCRKCNLQFNSYGIFVIPSQSLVGYINQDSNVNLCTALVFCDECNPIGDLTKLKQCCVCDHRILTHARQTPAFKSIIDDNHVIQFWDGTRHWYYLPYDPSVIQSLNDSKHICKVCFSRLTQSGAIPQVSSQYRDTGNESEENNVSETQPESIFSESEEFEDEKPETYLMSHDSPEGHKFHPSVEDGDVKCDKCMKRFISSHEEAGDRIGWGCASQLFELGILCKYGSIFDENFYSWKRIMPEEYRKFSKLCDVCVDECFQLGHIELISPEIEDERGLF